MPVDCPEATLWSCQRRVYRAGRLGEVRGVGGYASVRLRSDAALEQIVNVHARAPSHSTSHGVVSSSIEACMRSAPWVTNSYLWNNLKSPRK